MQTPDQTCGPEIG